MARKKKIEVGDSVKFNKLKDAAIFKVVEVNGFTIGVVPVDTPAELDPITQYIDVSCAIKVK